MAYGDYNHCNVCDRKLEYIGDRFDDAEQYACKGCVQNLLTALIDFAAIRPELQEILPALEWAKDVTNGDRNPFSSGYVPVKKEQFLEVFKVLGQPEGAE